MMMDKEFDDEWARAAQSLRGDHHSDLKASAQITDRAFLPGLRSASTTRQIAIALDRNPIPELTKLDLETRWQVGPDTVRKILRAFGIDPGGQKGALISLLEILPIEGVQKPLETWIAATDREREILASPLLTLEQLKERSPRCCGKQAATVYRRLKAANPSIRIGNQHRFRVDYEMSPRIPISDEEGHP